MSVVHGGKNGVLNPDECWKVYANCKAECDRMNENKFYAWVKSGDFEKMNAVANKLFKQE